MQPNNEHKMRLLPTTSSSGPAPRRRLLCLPWQTYYISGWKQLPLTLPYILTHDSASKFGFGQRTLCSTPEYCLSESRWLHIFRPEWSKSRQYFRECIRESGDRRSQDYDHRLLVSLSLPSRHVGDAPSGGHRMHQWGNGCGLWFQVTKTSHHLRIPICSNPWL